MIESWKLRKRSTLKAMLRWRLIALEEDVGKSQPHRCIIA